MAYETYGKVVGVIRNISRGNSCCSFLATIQTETETVNFVVTGETIGHRSGAAEKRDACSCFLRYQPSGPGYLSAPGIRQRW